jgi:ribonuclease HI
MSLLPDPDGITFEMNPDELPYVIIYTDGACDPNPGPGGWAAILQYGRKEKVLTGYEPDTTNNRMELTAAIQALRALNKPCRVDFYTDSEYLKRGITEWLPNWRKRNWKRKAGTLANLDLWQELDTVVQLHSVNWNWVRGHTGHHENERADRLARQAIKKR